MTRGRSRPLQLGRLARGSPWLTLACVAAGGLASVWPGAGAALQYDRQLVAAGEAWRLVTAQFVHWTPRMTLIDLGAILVLGGWLETHGWRRQVAAALAAALAVTALYLPLSALGLYRGSSGLGSALFVLAALTALTTASRGSRWFAALALAGFVAKLFLDLAGLAFVASGPLPAGIAAVPGVHLLCGAAGALAWRRSPATANGPGQPATLS